MNKSFVKLLSFSSKQSTYNLPEIDFKSEKIYYRFYSSLLCGKYPKDMTRCAYIGYNPFIIIRCRKQKNKISIFEVLIQKQKSGKDNNAYNLTDQEFRNTITKQYSKYYYIQYNFWDFLTVLYQGIGFENFSHPLNKTGLIGYLSYDAVHLLEKIPDENTDYINMPLFEAVLYEDYMVYDLHKKEKYIMHCVYNANQDFFSNEIPVAAIKYLDDQKELQQKAKMQIPLPLDAVKEKYRDKIKKIKEYIVNGDVYEVNLSALYSKKVGFLSSRNAFEFFLSIYEKNSSCYSAFLNFGKNKIISNSPEMFLKVAGRRVETRPIKGTAPVYGNFIKDMLSKRFLKRSIKDQAELYMIIDLLRNDLAKVSDVGSVKVKSKKRLERYQNYYHTIGIIVSELEKNKNYIDLIKAAFPGGSVTGCPKIRSMEIIEELEQYKRNLYTGSLFIMNSDYMAMSIVIRTALYQYPFLYYNSGGAITIDSDPEDEYNEIEIKVKNYLEILGR